MNGIVLAISFLFTSFAFAGADIHVSDGCGLGWQVTNKHTLVATTTRTTTNWVVHPTFGMTSGTMDCQKHTLVMADKVNLYYTEANFENLLAEIALGDGEFLTTFTQNLGCENALSFQKSLQSHYSQLVESPLNPTHLLMRVQKLKRSENFNCSNI